MKKGKSGKSIPNSSKWKPAKTLLDKLKKQSILEILGEETLKKISDDFLEKRRNAPPDYQGQGWF